MPGPAPSFASSACFGFASFSSALLLLTVLAFSLGALPVSASAADSCASVRSGAKVDPVANLDQSQPPESCSVRGLTESECDDIPGHKHFKSDQGSGFTECFFDPPASNAEPDRSQAPRSRRRHEASPNPNPVDENNECTAQLTTVEGTVRDKLEANTPSEADVDKVNELLDQADALCSEGNFADASATLAAVTKMFGP